MLNKIINKKDINEFQKEGKTLLRKAIILVVSSILITLIGVIWTISNIISWSISDVHTTITFFSTLMPLVINIMLLGLGITYYFYEKNRLMDKAKKKLITKTLDLIKNN